MKKTNLHFGFGLLLVMTWSLSACKKITADADEETTTTATVTLGSYTCPTYSNNTMYDSMLACQLASLANCTSSQETFPNGSSATCYTPKTGWQGCATNPPSWEYTVYTVQSVIPTGYRLKRSLLGCSSEICLCSAVAPPDIEMDVVFGAYVENVSGLPSPCTTTSCGPYVYQGAMTVAGVTYTLNTLPALVGTPPVSSDGFPTLTVLGPSGFIMNVYDNPTCTSLIGSAAIVAGTGTTGAMTMATGGMKNFWAKFTDGFTTTACADTGVSYFRVTAPTLAQPTTVLVPSDTYPAGSAITLTFSNTTNIGMTYTCQYDNIVDGAMAGASNCNSLTGAVFNTTNGILTYTPSSSLNNTFEFEVTGTNMAGSDTKYSAVYLINGAIYGIAPMADESTSANANPTISINGGAGAPSFNYGIFSDSSCSTLLASAGLNGSGVGSIPLALTNVPGMKRFYGVYQDPNTLQTTKCLNTNMNYHLITAPALAQPTPAIFPTQQLKTGVPITLNFQASDNTGVTYSCLYDQLVDNSTAGGTNCATLPSSSFGTSTGIFTWTPSTSAYGAYEFCVTANNIAGSDSECTVVDVIPNSLVVSGLSHYYDAQFSYNPLTVDGGANINPSNTWKDLIGSVDGTLNNTLGTTASGWFNTTFWNTAVSPNAWTKAYSARLNSGAGTVPLSNPTNPNNPLYPFVYSLHQDYADINPIANKTTNVSQSITFDMWINPIGTPLTTQSVMLQPNWCCGGVPQYCSIPDAGNGCSIFAMNNVPVYSLAGMIFYYYDNTDGDNPGISAYVRDEDMADNGIKDSSASGYRVVLDLKKYNGTWTTWVISGVYSYGSWKHITAIWNQPTLTKSLYIDGVFIGSVTEAPSNHFPITSRRLIMGCDTSANNRFNGEISRIRMYDSANVGIPPANYNAEKKQFGIP